MERLTEGRGKLLGMIYGSIRSSEEEGEEEEMQRVSLVWGYPLFRGISLKWPPTLQVPLTVQSTRRRLGNQDVITWEE